MAINKIQETGLAMPQKRVEKKYDKNGELETISVFMDINGDGKEDLYEVTRYSKSYDGSRHERMVRDFDGDGYNDYQLDTTYDKNGKKLEEKEYYEEDINKVKARNHFDFEIYNREMKTHQSGFYQH